MSLYVKNHLICNNSKVEIKSNFKLLHKALKTLSTFAENAPNFLLITNNAIYLGVGKCPQDSYVKKKHSEEHPYKIIEIDYSETSFKQLSKMIENLIYGELSEENKDLEKEDHFDEYAEHSFLGVRINTQFKGDKNTSSMELPSGRLFAKITPSWLTIEK